MGFSSEVIAFSSEEKGVSSEVIAISSEDIPFIIMYYIIYTTTSSPSRATRVRVKIHKGKKESPQRKLRFPVGVKIGQFLCRIKTLSLSSAGTPPSGLYPCSQP